MSWVTAIWAILIGGCITVALPQLVIWIWQRRVVHLLFVILTAAVVADLSTELVLMRAGSLEQFASPLRWRQVPLFVNWVAIVLFVRFYFGTGRWWLGIIACGVRLACLVINFALPPNLYFREMTALEPVRLLGETVSLPIGVVSSWFHLAELSSIPLIAFVLDASIGLWRQGKPWARRRALIIGGSIIFYEVLAASVGMLIHQTNRPAVVYVVSLPFVAVVFAMAFELSYDLFAAGQVAQNLQTSEASLLESELRFGRMADAAPVMIWTAGPDKLCTFFNKAWLDFTGRTMEQELGNGWSEGVHPDDFEGCLKTYVERFDALEPFFMKYRLRRSDGEYRYVTDTGVPRYGARGKFRGYIGACVDITDLLEKEQALRESEERMNLAIDAAKLGLWEWDFRKDELWGNTQRRAQLGLPLTGKLKLEDALSLVHVDDRERVRQTLKDATQGGKEYSCEYRVLGPDKREHWTELRGRSGRGPDGETIVLRGVVMDITERKQAQDLFRLATEASPSGAVLVDDHGRIILVNAHVEELFGYRRDELIGKPVEILMPETFAARHPEYRAKFHELPEARMMGAGRELFARRKDGTEFPIEIGLNPIQTQEGLLVLASVIDISARRLAEREARKSREEISRLSRISLLGEMTASIAHELGQPLTGISNNASAGQRFIDKGKVDIAIMHEILVDIEAQAHRASDVIRNIRNTVKKGAALRTRINLNELITRVGHILQPDARAHSSELKISLPEDSPVIEGDPVQIQQVLINLVGNAFESMLDTPIRKRRVEIVAEQKTDEMVCVSVSDRGMGISDEARERIFDQFFTTKEEGIGMGLAIVRSVIEAHGGKIEVEDLAGAGARFSFTLPTRRPSSS
jgi:PAS domain S-box-containing protein